MPGHITDCSNNNSVFTFLSEFKERSVAQVVGETIVLCLIFTIAVCSNILMLMVVMKPKAPLTSTHVLLANLVLSELLFILGMPLVVITRLSVDWLLGQPACTMVNYLAFVCSMSYLLTLTLISCDRYLCVRNGGSNRLSRRAATVIVIIIWITSLILSIPVALSEQTQTIHAGNNAYDTCISLSQGDCHQMCRERTYCGVEWPPYLDPQVYLFSIVVIFFICPLIIIIVVYVNIYLIVRRSSMRLERHTCNDSVGRPQTPVWTTAAAQERVGSRSSAHGATRYRHQTRLAKMVLVIVGSFVIMWLPFFVLGTIAESNKDISSTIFVLTLMLAYTNAGVNPFVYGYFNPAFRQQFQRLLPPMKLSCASLCRRQATDEPGPAVVMSPDTRSTEEGNGCHVETHPV